ncbi:MAG TPA: C40 family peptidase [Pedococcus sp.]|nr:C40 family peptidase [Pedococcus sp.]
MPGALHTRRVVRAGAAMSLIATMSVTTALAATAEPAPKPVYPSKSQVDRAKAAVTSTAGQISQLDAQYAAASARLADVQDQAAAANEAYNGARYELDQRTAEATAAKKRAADAQSRADAASLVVRQYAATVYQEGGSLGSLEAYLSASGPQDLMDRAAALEAVGDARARTLQQAAATSVVADTMRRQAALAEEQQAAAAKAAEAARDTAKTKAEQAQAAATQIQTQQQHLVTQLASLRKTSVDLEKQRQDGLAAAAAARAAAAEAARQARLAAARAKAARDAAAKRAAEAAAKRAAAEAARQRAVAAAAEKAAAKAAKGRTETPSPKPSDPPPPPPPASRGGVSAVIGYAQAQLGKPYGWGASGPSSFDCSGLTMMAWRQAGVYLSHYTGAQWSETSRVAISDLRPGDLVFFGYSGPSSHHVGLYVGGGQMIEAPHTGAVVRYASIYRSDLLPYGGRP